MKLIIPTIVLLISLPVASPKALALGAEPMCYRDEDNCRVVLGTTDPGQLLCQVQLPAYEPGREYVFEVGMLAEKWGKVFEVPRSWITSQAYAESRNRPLAKNESGATGVMQIKVSRARDLVRWIERSAYGEIGEVKSVLARLWRGVRSDLCHMELNVMLAAYDLRRLMGKFGRSHAIVAAAYNQGEGRVGRCLRQGRPIPARGIEYVTRVMRAKRAGYV